MKLHIGIGKGKFAFLPVPPIGHNIHKEILVGHVVGHASVRNQNGTIKLKLVRLVQNRLQTGIIKPKLALKNAHPKDQTSTTGINVKFAHFGMIPQNGMLKHPNANLVQREVRFGTS